MSLRCIRSSAVCRRPLTCFSYSSARHWHGCWRERCKGRRKVPPAVSVYVRRVHTAARGGLSASFEGDVSLSVLNTLRELFGFTEESEKGGSFSSLSPKEIKAVVASLSQRMAPKGICLAMNVYLKDPADLRHLSRVMRLPVPELESLLLTYLKDSLPELRAKDAALILNCLSRLGCSSSFLRRVSAEVLLAEGRVPVPEIQKEDGIHRRTCILQEANGQSLALIANAFARQGVRETQLFTSIGRRAVDIREELDLHQLSSLMHSYGKLNIFMHRFIDRMQEVVARRAHEMTIDQIGHCLFGFARTVGDGHQRNKAGFKRAMDALEKSLMRDSQTKSSSSSLSLSLSTEGLTLSLSALSTLMLYRPADRLLSVALERLGRGGKDSIHITTITTLLQASARLDAFSLSLSPSSTEGSHPPPQSAGNLAGARGEEENRREISAASPEGDSTIGTPRRSRPESAAQHSVGEEEKIRERLRKRTEMFDRLVERCIASVRQSKPRQMCLQLDSAAMLLLTSPFPDGDGRGAAPGHRFAKLLDVTSQPLLESLVHSTSALFREREEEEGGGAERARQIFLDARRSLVKEHPVADDRRETTKLYEAQLCRALQVAALLPFHHRDGRTPLGLLPLSSLQRLDRILQGIIAPHLNEEGATTASEDGGESQQEEENRSSSTMTVRYSSLHGAAEGGPLPEPGGQFVGHDDSSGWEEGRYHQHSDLLPRGIRNDSCALSQMRRAQLLPQNVSDLQGQVLSVLRPILRERRSLFSTEFPCGLFSVDCLAWPPVSRPPSGRGNLHSRQRRSQPLTSASSSAFSDMQPLPPVAATRTEPQTVQCASS
uniref:RNA-editing substrate-binding complex 6 protein domain-containing protein n=1 Tax=Chromera velia CCMP2878 TaxID=1169474 RepID=A0A0G4HBZ5_9ALVE|eukprot:Cvel_26078.t1-p1 / transcript=Cvel_26078.t1 / gene=Cvel_26078 / organism=Chromera_velia_CCMP2878 / gene_product=hypothetical protein / transcript_product=hypothetical protein / location=Cvel_scaffold3044:10717-15013(-) / protein_length=832 / sequence_SO=supercontig / SO=protein_coding / is_pseudo=false